jgi:HK97 family phage prohead protease
MSGTDVDYKTLVQGRTGVEHKTVGLETKQFLAPLIIKSVDVENRRITAIASTGDIDRYDEIILPEAFRESLPIYMKNNIVLAAHAHKLAAGHSPVIANIIKANITKNGLEVIIEFHDITELAEEYWQLYSQKKQRALSVGFKPQEGGNEEIDGRRVYVHTKVELFEVSCVPVPANPEALSRSAQKKHTWLDDKKLQQKWDKEDQEFADILLGVKKTGIPIVDNPGESLFDFEETEPWPEIKIESDTGLDCAEVFGTHAGIDFTEYF